MNSIRIGAVNVQRLASVLALLLLAFFIFPAKLQAQAIPSNLVCDPLPVDDPDKLNECILLMGTGSGGFNAVTPQTPSTCNPWPEDLAGSEYCTMLYGIMPVARTYSPGTDPNSPASFLNGGGHGIASGYDPDTDRILVAAQSYDTNKMTVVLVDGQALAAVKPPVSVETDPGNTFSGSPQIMYNPAAQRFLVTWLNNNADLKGRLVNGDGTPLGQEFMVAPRIPSNAVIGIEYDSFRHCWVVYYDHDGIYVTRIDGQGQITDPPTKVLSTPSTGYIGQPDMTYNPDSDEYWITYVRCVNGDASCVYAMSRIPAERLTAIGETMSFAPVTGSSPAIVYNSADHNALVVYNQITDGHMGIYGRIIGNDLSDTGQFPVSDVTTNTYPLTIGIIGGSSVSYSPWTNTYYIAGQEWESGGIAFLEVSDTGLVLQNHQALADPPGGGAPGNFYSRSLATLGGGMIMANPHYATLTGTTTPSVAPLIVPDTQTPSVPPSNPAPADTSSIGKIVVRLYTWALGAAGLLALLMVILGGFRIMTASGNAAAVSAGKEYIYGAVIGLALLLGSYLILSTINPDLVDFNLESINTLNAPPPAH